VSPWVVTRTIAAPIDRVFETVADIKQFSQAVPQIVKVEFLSAQQSGVGTRFRETRLMKGKETATELEVTELVRNDHIRLVADTHGTVWDSIFQVKRVGDATALTLIMDARPAGLLPRVMMLLIAAWCSGPSRPISIQSSNIASETAPRDPLQVSGNRSGVG
jgi:carbon monoxide dehydrogenase subunit G